MNMPRITFTRIYKTSDLKSESPFAAYCLTESVLVYVIIMLIPRKHKNSKGMAHPSPLIFPSAAYEWSLLKDPPMYQGFWYNLLCSPASLCPSLFINMSNMTKKSLFQLESTLRSFSHDLSHKYIEFSFFNTNYPFTDNKSYSVMSEIHDSSLLEL